MGILSRKKNNDFQKPPLVGVYVAHHGTLTIGICKCRNHSNPVRSQQLEDIKLRETNFYDIRFQVKEVDSPGKWYTDDIVLPKRRLCYQSYVEISVFGAVPLSSQRLTNMIRELEATETLGVQPGRG
ncbi:hypothetical protein TNCV_4217201 [Trichonephila clavipes]|nr:hypothetical protein TNCV_4217201 [Trichonephila clavipes]